MSMDVLLGRFADFVQSQPMPEIPVQTAEAFPDELAHIRDVCGHHIVLLTLLAQADGDRQAAEIQQIVSHCVDRARQAGITISPAERASLEAYLNGFRASRMQLDPALKRLHHDTKENFLSLIAAAQRLVEADGVERQEEMRLLGTLQRDLAEA